MSDFPVVSPEEWEKFTPEEKAEFELVRAQSAELESAPDTKAFIAILKKYRPKFNAFRRARKAPGEKYEVLVCDKTVSAPFPETWTAASFDTEEEAIEYCKARIRRTLKQCYKPGMTAERLFGMYKYGGDFPEVPESDFEAWGYAEQQAQIMCSSPEQQTGA